MPCLPGWGSLELWTEGLRAGEPLLGPPPWTEARVGRSYLAGGQGRDSGQQSRDNIYSCIRPTFCKHLAVCKNLDYRAD